MLNNEAAQNSNEYLITSFTSRDYGHAVCKPGDANDTCEQN